MIDIGGHPLTLGFRFDEPPDWLRPMVDLGRRDAAFVDTGYLLALSDPNDPYHSIATDHWNGSALIGYTTQLVLAETVRGLAKRKGLTQSIRVARVEHLKRLTIDENDIIVCAPPRELVLRAFRELIDMQRILDKLDLCDCCSMLALDEAQHRRVLTFDNTHFGAVGAFLEFG